MRGRGRIHLKKIHDSRESEITLPSHKTEL